MTVADPTVVAVINTSPDVVDLLRRALESAGLVVVTALTFEIRDGAVDIERFVRQHDPRVIVYDIAPPYDANWKLFQHICRMAPMRHRQFVLTSTNTKHVQDLTGKSQRIYEVVGKPLDLDRIVRAVKEAARARPTG
jgi:DNA-binding NtrC family response regulator